MEMKKISVRSDKANACWHKTECYRYKSSIGEKALEVDRGKLGEIVKTLINRRWTFCAHANTHAERGEYVRA